jgi:hypothetical protein
VQGCGGSREDKVWLNKGAADAEFWDFYYSWLAVIRPIDSHERKTH